MVEDDFGLVAEEEDNFGIVVEEADNFVFSGLVVEEDNFFAFFDFFSCLVL